MIPSKNRPRPQGFSLIEVTLAIGVAAFCLVALFGLLPVGVTSNQTTLAQTAAAGIAASIVADLRATPASATATPSPLYGIPIPAGLNDTPLTHTVFLHEDNTAAVYSTSTPAPTVAPGVGTTVDVDAVAVQNPRYRATLTFFPPAAGQRSATSVRVLITWPATANPRFALDPLVDKPSRFSGSFETVTALDRH